MRSCTTAGIVVNGKYVKREKNCTEFSEQFQSVFTTNTVNSDKKYDSKVKTEDNDNTPKVDIGICQLQALGKVKLESRI